MMKQCNLVEFFSGIGSQAKALKNLGIKINTIGTSEWDVHAIAAYDVIHNSPEIPEDIQQMSKEELLEVLSTFTFSNSGKEALDFPSFRTYSTEVLRRIYTSIKRNNNFVDITSLSGSMMPENIDLLTYSFPCQDLSNVGAFHGYNKGIDKDSGSRSSLLWQVGRILTEMKACGKALPKYLLMENVPTLLSKRHSANFNMWIGDLEELGYISNYYQLNASFFGLPQNRPRLLMISVYIGDNDEEKKLISDYFSFTDEKKVVADYCASEFYRPLHVQDLLRTNYSNKKIFQEALDCTPNDTPSRRKIWNDNPQIVLPDGTINPEIDVIRTITTKQDRNPNSGNLYFDSGIPGRSTFRYLTPRECLLFMGFTDDDYKRLRANNIEFHKGDALFARDKIIRLAGNSIPVKLLEGVFYQILRIDEILGEYRKDKSDFSVACGNTDYNGIIHDAFRKANRRVRISGQYPLDATFVYPAAKLAVYIQPCLERLHKCKVGKTTLYEIDYWKKRSQRILELDFQKYESAVSMGYLVLVVPECQMDSNGQVLEWILRYAERGMKTAESGIMYYGR